MAGSSFVPVSNSIPPLFSLMCTLRDFGVYWFTGCAHKICAHSVPTGCAHTPIKGGRDARIGYLIAYYTLHTFFGVAD